MPIVGAVFERAAEDGFYPDNDDLGIPYKCPKYLPGKDYALTQLAYVESMIEKLQDSWGDDLAEARVSRRKLDKDDQAAREAASREIARIKRERRDRLEAYKRQERHWKKVIRELED